MNKELGRKITSLTLMTIMLTWSAAMGFSSTFMPEAFAENQYLYVSAESAGFVAGAQVIEIVVAEPSISELDTAYGMPDVNVNGSSILMAQAVDGAWYAYIVDAYSSNVVDSYYTLANNGQGGGADFGIMCGPTTELAYKNDGASETGLSASETQGIWLPYALGDANAKGYDSSHKGASTYSAGDSLTDCSPSAAEWTDGRTTGINATSNLQMNVVRESPALSNQTTANEYGNIRLGANAWPMIQMLDFTGDGMIDIVYNRAGADETVSLVYTDSADGLSFDKDVYGLEHEVGLTLTDWNLNIDPTDEDSWTFGTLPSNATVFYQLFDENGARDSDGTANFDNAFNSATAGDIVQAGVFTIDRNGDAYTADATTNAVIDFQDNADTLWICADGLCGSSSHSQANQPLTMTEAGANTGVFINWDEGLVTNMVINTDAPRGTQAIFNYDGIEYGVLTNPTFGTIEYDLSMIGDEWNSGEVVNINIFDPDMNYDARYEDSLGVGSNNSVVPAIKIGSPITLATLSTLIADTQELGTQTIDTALNNQCSSDYDTSQATGYTSCYEKYSERSIITTEMDLGKAFAANDNLLFTHSSDTTVKTFKDLIAGANGTGAYTYVQFDLRSLNNGSDNLSFGGNFTFGDSTIRAGGIGDVGYYDSGESDKLTANDNRGAASFSGLVGNAPVNIPTEKLYGLDSLTDSDALTMQIKFLDADTSVGIGDGKNIPLTVDIVSWGQSNDGVTSSDRHNNAIYRIEAEETDNNNSNLFSAEVEFVMLNQLNVNDSGTYNDTVAYGDEIVMIIHNDSTDEDEVRVSYLDLGSDGVETQISAQLAAPTHSGVVEFDADSYKEADTVTVTLTDPDLNTSPEVINIYTVVNSSAEPANDMVGKAGYGQNTVGDNFGRMLDITIDDEQWLDSDETSSSSNLTCSSDLDDGVTDGLYNSGFSLVETGVNTGVFTGDFQIPPQYGARSSGTCTVTSTLGKDLEVNYVDYRDASGEIIEVGDGAGIRANTGSVSLDRTVYPVPFGEIDDFSVDSSKKTPNSRSLFPIHNTGMSGSYLDSATETLGSGDLTIHIRVDDPDYDVSATGEDQIAENTTNASDPDGDGTSTNKHGPLKIYVSRGSESVVLATAGGTTSQDGVITDGSSVVVGGTATGTRQLGPIAETAPDSGVFELDMTVRYTDGPDSADCPSKTDNFTNTDGTSTATDKTNSSTVRFATTASSQYHCILQGDVITVEYTDQNDASGNSGVAYDSATFDMRNGVLHTDKSV